MKYLRFNTLVVGSIGLLLGVLLIVSGVAYLQARQTKNSLDTVLVIHVPVLKLLLDSKGLLYSANENFKNFTLSERVPLYEVSEAANLLIEEFKTFNSNHTTPYSQVLLERSRAMSDKIALLSDPTVNRTQLLNKIYKDMEEIRHNVRSYAHRYSQEQIWKRTESNIINVSNLLVGNEYELSRYLSQTKVTLNQLVSPLQQCLKHLRAIVDLDGDATIFSGQEVLLLKLTEALKKYKSSIALYFDEDLLEVSGANLEEIMAQVVVSQETALSNFTLLESRVFENISSIHERIQITTEVQQKMLIIVAILGIFVASITSLLLLQLLSKRIRCLVQGAESIADGNLSTRIIFDRNGDQLNRLARAFNDMAASLQNREIEARAQQRKLVRAQRMEALGLMAGGVAHDLNNILSAVVGYPSLILENSKLNSELRNPLIAMREAGERAVEVVADLLAIAKGAAVEKEVSHLNLIINDFIHSLECQQVREKYPKISFGHNLAAIPDTILCSSTHIQKCLMNLLLNAAEAVTEDGVISINTANITINRKEISLYTPAEGEYVVLEVQDNGTGISKQDLEHIFEPFYTKKILGRSGTGLGLSVVWNTIQDHDGNIRVSSDSGGTCFSIYFPVKEASPCHMQDNVSKDMVEGAGEHILVVDDEPQLRDLAGHMLKRLGYTVESVSSGEEAIEFLRKNRSDVILLDMQMDPGISGRQTYEKILQFIPSQKVVIASGFSDSDDIKATRQLGAEGFLKKPYTLRDLGTVIRDCLKMKKEKATSI